MAEIHCQSLKPLESSGAQSNREPSGVGRSSSSKSMWGFVIWAKVMGKRSENGAPDNDQLGLVEPQSDLKDFSTSVGDVGSSAESSGASTCSEELATVAVSHGGGISTSIGGTSLPVLHSPAKETTVAASKVCAFQDYSEAGPCGVRLGPSVQDKCRYDARVLGSPPATSDSRLPSSCARRCADQLHAAPCIYIPSSPSTCAADQASQRSGRQGGSFWCFGFGRSWRRRHRRAALRRTEAAQRSFYQSPKDAKVVVVSLAEAQDFCPLDQSGSLSFKSLRSRMGSSGSVGAKERCFATVAQCHSALAPSPSIATTKRGREFDRVRPSRSSEGLLSFLKAASWGNALSRDLSRSRSKGGAPAQSDTIVDAVVPRGDPTYLDDASEFFSVEGDNFDWEGLTHGLLGREESCTSSSESPSGLASKSSSGTNDRAPAPCSCGYACHLVVYDERMPLHTAPNVSPDSYEERLAIARALRGHWITIVERSESLDGQYKLLGLGMVKRAVMNRLAVPLTMFLEQNDTVLHCWIHTPLGIRHMCSNLEGSECVDDDPDAGRWIGTTATVAYSIPWYCGGKPVRALQQTRHNPKIGTSVETRCILPDPEHGKVMLFNFLMYPKGKPESARLSADRILYLESENV